MHIQHARHFNTSEVEDPGSTRIEVRGIRLAIALRRYAGGKFAGHGLVNPHVVRVARDEHHFPCEFVGFLAQYCDEIAEPGMGRACDGIEERLKDVRLDHNHDAQRARILGCLKGLPQPRQIRGVSRGIFLVVVIELVRRALHNLVLQVVVAAGNVDGCKHNRSLHQYGIFNVERIFWIVALPLQSDGSAAQAEVGREVSLADQIQPAKRVVGAVAVSQAVRPFVVAYRIQQGFVEAVELIQDFWVVRIVAARGTIFGVADVDGEVDILPVDIGDDTLIERFRR